MKETDYKYIASQGKCEFDKSKVVAKVTDCTSYNLTSQEKAKQVLYKDGPISIGKFLICNILTLKVQHNDTT